MKATFWIEPSTHQHLFRLTRHLTAAGIGFGLISSWPSAPIYHIQMVLTQIFGGREHGYTLQNVWIKSFGDNYQRTRTEGPDSPIRDVELECFKQLQCIEMRNICFKLASLRNIVSRVQTTINHDEVGSINHCSRQSITHYDLIKIDVCQCCVEPQRISDRSSTFFTYAVPCKSQGRCGMWNVNAPHNTIPSHARS